MDQHEGVSNKSVSSLRRAAKAGDHHAQLALALKYLGREHGLRRDYRIIARLLRMCAPALPAAALEFSHLYREGFGVRPDPHAADRWLLRSAHGGHVPAMVELADRAATGNDIETAIKWARAAHDQGNIEGTALLGLLFVKHPNGHNDAEAGRALLDAAAEGGQFDAILALGYIWSEGRGVVPDGAKAIRYFRMAAPHYSRAQIGGSPCEALWRIYSEGKLVPRDITQALHWLAADVATHSETPLLELARIFREGDGVKADETLAEFWENRAKEW